jgi:hypothetical protein
MELDKKIRDDPLPEGFRDKNDLATSFQRCVLDHIKETGMIVSPSRLLIP